MAALMVVRMCVCLFVCVFLVAYTGHLLFIALLV